MYLRMLGDDAVVFWDSTICLSCAVLGLGCAVRFELTSQKAAAPISTSVITGRP